MATGNLGPGECMMGNMSPWAAGQLENVAWRQSAKLKGTDEGVPTGQPAPGIHKNLKWHFVPERTNPQKMGLPVQCFGAAELRLLGVHAGEWLQCGFAVREETKCTEPWGEGVEARDLAKALTSRFSTLTMALVHTLLTQQRFQRIHRVSDYFKTASDCITLRHFYDRMI